MASTACNPGRAAVEAFVCANPSEERTHEKRDGAEVDREEKREDDACGSVDCCEVRLLGEVPAQARLDHLKADGAS